VLTPTLITAFLPSDVARDLSRLLPPSQQEECALYLRQFEGLSAAQQAVLRDAGRRLVRVVLDAGVPILAGTDAPAFCALPGESFAIELALLRDAGLSPLAVLQSATLTPARVFGPADRYGRLAAGYSADLVLLRDNPLTNPSAYREPLGVFTRSRWWDAASLQALRQ